MGNQFFSFKKNTGHIGAVMQVNGAKENTKLTLPKATKMPWNKISSDEGPDGKQKGKMDYYTGVTFKEGIYCNSKVQNLFNRQKDTGFSLRSGSDPVCWIP